MAQSSLSLFRAPYLARPFLIFLSSVPNASDSQMARVWEQTRARAIWKSIHVLPEAAM
jgi:hypothetical protein